MAATTPSAATTATTTAAPAGVTELDALIIGAGVAGLYQLYRLREQGLKVKAVETGNGVAGTWYWNRYPGARVDSPSNVYQYWFSREIANEWNWSERFPAQPEVERYLNFVADRCDLRKDILFETRVTAATYDEAARRWLVTTDKGQTIHAQFLISCTGMLSAPLIMQIPGQEKFKGVICHTRAGPGTSTAPANASASSAPRPPASRSSRPWPPRSRSSTCSSARRSSRFRCATRN